LDSTLGYLFLAPALLVIVGLVAYPFANAIVMTLQQKNSWGPRSLHWPGQLS
jgi:ABC-type sugar transport system permease subunit